MFDCRFCNFNSEAQLPLYRMCCEANMTYRCVDIINHHDDDIYQDDINWLRKDEEERKEMTTYRPLTTKAYKCYHDMYTLLEQNGVVQWSERNLDYCVIKIKNKHWYRRSISPTTVYVSVQVIDSQLTNQKLYINNISNGYGEESYNEYINAKRRIARSRNSFRYQQQYQQIINDYTYFQRRIVNDASEILLNLRDATVERNLIDEFNAAEEEDNESDEEDDQLPDLVSDEEDNPVPDLEPYDNYENESYNEDQELVTKKKVIEATECAICFDNLGETNKIILRCGHQFCGDCIFRHYQCRHGSKCPSCRAKFV